MADCEREPFGGERTMLHAEEAQIVGASALHELQVARVIDAAGEIRVLEVDALEELVARLGQAAGNCCCALFIHAGIRRGERRSARDAPSAQTKSRPVS